MDHRRAEAPGLCLRHRCAAFIRFLGVFKLKTATPGQARCMRARDCSSTEVVRPARRAAPFAALTVQAPARLPVLLLLPWPAAMPWPAAAATSPCRCCCGSHMHAGVLSTGHCHPKVVEAIQRQARDAARLLHAGGACVLRVGASSSYHRQLMTGFISAWTICVYGSHCAFPCPATPPAGQRMTKARRRR